MAARSMRVLIITSVASEAEAAQRAARSTADRRSSSHAVTSNVVISGVGRVNAACAVTESIVRHGPFELVINAGIAGVLPSPAENSPADEGSGHRDRPTFALGIGDLVVASSSVYAEEGLLTPDGFRDMASLGFPLGDFDGNAVPGDPSTLARLTGRVRIGRIATVATCSGTDEQARIIAQRTGALAEAMEGAAAIHAARRLHTPAIEVRAISNTTGDRSRQVWDIARAMAALEVGLVEVLDCLAAR